jgi:hypothetical protein
MAFAELQKYWTGPTLIADILKQRLKGTDEVDLLGAMDTHGSLTVPSWALPSKYQ